LLRLNVSIKPSRNPSRLGVLAGDLAGFPNGRRLADDVTDIELRALAGVLVKGFDIEPNNRLGDGVDFNDRRFLDHFPYVTRPSDPLASNHRVDPPHHPGKDAQRISASVSVDDDDIASIDVIGDESVAGADDDAPIAPLEVRGANPAKTAQLRYALPRDATVTLRIYDVGGRMVRALIDGPSKAGSVDVQWDGRDDFGTFAGKGMFFARYSVDGKVVSSKKLVIR